MSPKASDDRAAPGGSLTGSKDARRLAAGILEVLAGLRTPAEACEALGYSLGRYYQLETRALQGMVDGLERKPHGRRKTLERQLEDMQKEKERLEKELGRSQSLLRAAHRSIGLPSVPKGKRDKTAETTKSGRKRRKSKPRVRATRAIDTLRSGSEPDAGTTTPPTAQKKVS